MITIKSFEEIYNDLKQNFYKRTKIDIEPRSVIDMIIKAIADSLHSIHQIVEKNKKPYLFTNQTGEELDNFQQDMINLAQSNGYMLRR